MNPLSIASLVASGAKALFGLGQGIFGASRANKLWNNRPQLGVTAGEKNNDLLFNRQASATEMPGQKQTEEKLNQAVAEGMYGAQQSAPSSLNATQAAVDLSGKKMQAIQDLAGQFAEYKSQRMDALAGWNNQKTALEQQRFQVNQYDPWQMQYGKTVGNTQQGANAFTGGVDTGLGILGDLQGTKSFTDMMSKIYGIGGGGTGTTPTSTNAPSLWDLSPLNPNRKRNLPGR